MSEYFQKHESLQFSNEPADPADYLPREPDSRLEEAYEDRQNGGYEPEDGEPDPEDERLSWVAELAGDPERDFEEEKFNQQLMREE